VAESGILHLSLIQQHIDTALPEHQREVKTFDRLEKGQYGEGLLKDVDQY
jgi:hypothetical protein